jgi:predicted dehydrogenase
MTYLSVGIVGHGSVALVHVASLSGLPGIRTSAVLGRDAARAARFAGQIGATAFGEIAAFADAIDLAIIASPSACHAEHAAELLKRGVSVLIELPVARDSAEFATIRAANPGGGVSVFSTHTARFLAATALVSAVLEKGQLGSVQRVTIERSVRHRDRSWPDDPLLHHGQHALDLLDVWFGTIALGSATIAADGKSVVVTGSVGHDTPFSLSVGHEAAQESMRVSILGSGGWIRTDGFGRAETSPGISTQGWRHRDPGDAYLGAISAQDAAVVEAIRGSGTYPSIEASARTTELVDVARALARRR